MRFATFRAHAGPERIALAEDLGRLEADERVLVETCHRVELVTVDARGGPPAAVRGREAVHRVLEVVAGFDSAVVAEEQLLGQVREAYDRALTAGASGPILNELFRRALRFGREVRSHARPGTDRSLADPAAAWMADRTSPGSRVAVVGTGEMGRLVAGRLADAGYRITVVSASPDRGRRLLESLPRGGHDLAVGPIRPNLVATAAGLVLAVRGSTPSLDSRLLPPDGAAMPWVVDLSAPPAVDRTAAERLGDRLLDLDGLGRHHHAMPVLAPTIEARLRNRLEAEVERFATWVEDRRGAGALSLLRREADAVRRRHLERLRRRADLTEHQLAAVEATTSAMLGELLHGPSIELRRGAADAATVRRLFRIDA